MKILNVGCGNDTYGTDFIDLYPQRNEVIKCAIDNEKFPYEDNIFDEVRLYFVFEHLKNHEQVLKEIYRVLKVGGRLDLKTDNASYWYFALPNRTHSGAYEEEHFNNRFDRHFGLFTMHHLKNYLEDVGLEIIMTHSSYDNAKGPEDSTLRFKGKVVLVINYLLTHFGRCIKNIGYGDLQIIGVK